MSALVVTVIALGLLVGLLASGLARLLIPGAPRPSLLGTTLLGLVGALVGAYLGDLVTTGREALGLEPGVVIGGVTGAVVAVMLHQLVAAVRAGRRG
jgi:uncharacterized membrane protein YeaQ/YmgE (transglycosylase-associated protein family)